MRKPDGNVGTSDHAPAEDYGAGRRPRWLRWTAVRWSRRHVWAAAPVALLLAIAGCGGGKRGPEVVPAQRFVDSIGVNVHTSYADTAYGNRAGVRAAVRELGVRHIRDGLVVRRPDQYAALRALARDRISADLILGDPRGRFGTGTLDQQVATLGRELPGVVETVEGPNEYDGSGDPAWPKSLAAYQRRLGDLVRGDPSAPKVPIVGPSLIDASDWSRLGDLRSALDVANVHWYPAGEPPTRDALDAQIRLVRRGTGRAPVYVTESGYHNAPRAPATAQPGVSERAAAAYLPRLLLSDFEAGATRTYVYELVDERADPGATDPEQHFGLVRHDFSRKPAFAALRNTIALLADPGPSFEPSPLDVSASGDEPLGHLLLEKRDGTYYLALWRPGASLWSTSSRADLTPSPVTVRVRLGRRAQRVRAYDPVRSVRPLASWERTDAVSLELGGDAVLLEIRPS